MAKEGGCLLHHPYPFAFGAHHLKNLRVLRLRYAKIKIPVKLLQSAVIVGMIYLCLRTVRDGITILNQFSRKNHIFIKNRMPLKSAKRLISAPLVHRTHIRTKKGLDPKRLQIVCGLDAALFSIIKASGIALNHMAVRHRKLSGIRRRYRLPSIHLSSCGKGLIQPLDQAVICRDRILRKKQQKRALQHFCRHMPRSAMVKFTFPDVDDLHMLRAFQTGIIKKFPLRIHQQNPGRLYRLPL